ncbi:MAG TPA: type II toxin-antitoxin system VapB family antitoxin [Desulfobacterales bacterium]
MKTTIKIPDSLLEAARQVAARENTTLKALVEEGLRRVIDERRQSSSFRLRKVTFQGDGLQPDLEGSRWKRIREKAYEGRGG